MYDKNSPICKYEIRKSSSKDSIFSSNFRARARPAITVSGGLPSNSKLDTESVQRRPHCLQQHAWSVVAGGAIVVWKGSVGEGDERYCGAGDDAKGFVGLDGGSVKSDVSSIDIVSSCSAVYA